MKTNIVRTMFCKQCFDNHRPHSKERFVLLSKTGLLVYKLKFNPPARNYGFTPHLIDEYTDKGDKLLLETFCLMEDCGIRIEPKGEDTYTIYLRNAKIISIFKRDWIALQAYIDADYSLL